MSEYPNLMSRVETDLIKAEIQRIKEAIHHGGGDKEDLVTYAKSVIETRLRLLSFLSREQETEAGRSEHAIEGCRSSRAQVSRPQEQEGGEA